jgi:Arc/MetJ family transcription regulator
MLAGMTRITVDVNDEWLAAAQQLLGTPTKVATINGALRELAIRVQAARIVEAFDSVPMDFEGSAAAFGYGGGRDLSTLAGQARGDDAA